ncbi:MBG domain-containing protein [Bacteroides sp. CG01]|uniref:MBG domain-containing protein n=1 Tax=Bacteroides sp. CG01 TaxID=3096000 RepID=UPI002AFED837|nr:MBG domain-containing protein [Bacteroides sp. CG01]
MKRTITACICALVFGGSVMAQNYQIPNSDFEANWTKNEKKNRLGKVMYTEMTPDFWHSFYDAKGDVVGAAFVLADQTGKLDQIAGRDGVGYAAQIIGRKNFIGTISNGNLTTGIVNMGSTTASDKSNYNYSEMDNENGHCKFAGMPDSVKVWLKFESKDTSKGNASVSMILHTGTEYKDPSTIMGEDAEKAARIAKAYSEIVPNVEWTQYTIPFEYNDNDLYKTYTDQKYMLTSFSTNKTPGVGTAGDALSVDDIQMIYNSKLESITINGVALAGFDKNTYTYGIRGEVPAISDIVAVSDGKGAKVEIQANGNNINIIVTGNDGGENQHTYILKFAPTGEVMKGPQIKGDFEAWEDCIAWDAVGAYGPDWATVGKQPQGWTASNVSQMGMTKEFVTIDAAGHMGSAPKITNEFVGIPGFLGANAPAFITLGNTWVFPDVQGMMASLNPEAYPDAKDLSDGGVTGGISFTNRPDSLTVYYKRALGTENPNESAKILIYLWKGTFKSKVIAGHVLKEDQTGFEEPTYKEVVDQDRAVLGKGGAEILGGSNGVLIGSAEYTIEGAQSEWVRLSIPITYITEDIPEKMNIVFSGCNYWIRSEIGAGNTLWVDDAALVYNAQLKDITVGGTSITGFKSDVYNYVLPYAEASKGFEVLSWGKDAEVSIVEKEKTATKVVKEITVTDNTTKDVTKTYVYTVTFQGAQAIIGLPTEVSHEYVYGDEALLNFTSNNPAEMSYEISDESVLKYDSDTKKFKMIGVGSATIVAKQVADANFAPATSEPFNVTISKAKLTVSFKEGTAWCRRGQYATWYADPAERLKRNSCDAEFSIKGLKNGDDLSAALGDRNISVSAPTGKAEVVGGYRAATLKLTGSGGNTTAHYDMEFLSDQKMLIKKTLVKVAAKYAGKFIWASSGAKEIVIPVGEDASCIRPYFSGFLSGENATIVESNLPVFQCPDITKNSPAGTTSSLTVTLPDESTFPNHELVSDLTEGGIVKTAPAPNFSVTEKDLNATYGEKRKLTVTKDEEVEYSIERTYNSTAVDNEGTVTMTKAGKETLILYVTPTETLAGKEQIVNIDIAKAPFTVKAKNVSLPLGEETPKTFELEFTGFVNEDDSAKVFTTAPSAVLGTEIPSDVKVGDEFSIVVDPGKSDNYDLVAVNGILAITTNVGITTNSLSDVRVYSKNGAICVINNVATDIVEVYTTQGVQVYKGTDNVITANIEKGTMYVVRIGSYVAKLIAE